MFVVCFKSRLKEREMGADFRIGMEGYGMFYSEQGLGDEIEDYLE